MDMSLSEEEKREFVDWTNQWTGRDLTDLCTEACEKAQESAGEEGTPMLTIDAFHAVFDKTRPSVNPEDIQQIEE
jgi:SpoVK/Ycf46/Vps4 family AAA+-type ATPase